MPRRPRVFVDGATYHVYCRTGRNDALFRQPEEVRVFLDVVTEVKREDGLTLLAWCVMPTHYHLVVRTGSIPLWKSMRLIQGRFAKSFNRRHDVLGSVWQGRYKAKLVAGERYLQQAIVYVHANPVAAKLATSPGAFRWSGHHELESGEATLLDSDEMLLAFGGRRSEARGTYMQAVSAAASASWWTAAPGRLPWWQGARDDGDIEPPAGRPRLDALGATTSDRAAREIGDFFAGAAALLGTTGEELRTGRSGRELTRWREAVTLVGVERFGFRINDLAAQFGRHPSVVSRWGVTATKRRREDATFRGRVGELAAGLAASPSASPGEGWADEAILGADATFID